MSSYLHTFRPPNWPWSNYLPFRCFDITPYDLLSMESSQLDSCWTEENVVSPSLISEGEISWELLVLARAEFHWPFTKEDFATLDDKLEVRNFE